MSDIDTLFREHQKQEDYINLKALGIQLSVNLFCCIVIFGLFCWLRPRFPHIYSPKSNLTKYDIRRPRTLGPGLFDWIMPTIRMKDNELIEHIGFDAYIFLYFTRLLRQLIIILTLISMFIFLPLNIVATYNTGDWPPAPGIDFMSISAMNYHSGKESHSPNYLWFWSPTIASWVISAIVLFQFYFASEKFLRFRMHYYQKKYKQLQPSTFSPTELVQYQKQDLISRTLLVHLQFTEPLQDTSRHKSKLRESSELKDWIDSSTQLSCQNVYIGKYNPRLYLLVNDYKSIIKKLEKALNYYTDHNKKRPTLRMGWKLEKLDAIDHYTNRALALEKVIQKNRSRLQDCNYAWIVYPTSQQAREASVAIEKNLLNKPSSIATCIQIQLAPQPQDIIWSSMNIDPHTFLLKQWYGYTLFMSTLFIWCIPFALLAVSSNMINLIRLFPQSDRILQNNDLLMGVIQSYLTPCLTVLLQYKVPQALHYIARQQAYKTNTVIERKTLLKLYIFFIINNLFIFTLVNIMLGIVGQITALYTLTTKDIAPYIVQIAKNMTDLSSFWIDYVCFRAVGASFELLRVYMLNRRQTPPYFQFARNYGLLISFFTAVLVYSVAAPIVLPFALVYFALASIAYKYKLVYIYVTETETHGQTWVLLCRLVTCSLIVFQAMMILLLSLKAGMQQTYTLIPLPIITGVLGFVYTRYLDRQNSLEAWLELTKHADSATTTITGNDELEQCMEDRYFLNTMYTDTAQHEPLCKPTLRDTFTISQIYEHHPQFTRIRDTLFSTISTQAPVVTIIPTSPSLQELNVIYHDGDTKQQHIETIPMQPIPSTIIPTAPPPPYLAHRRHSI